MAKKNYWNGILLGVGIALLAYASAQYFTWLNWLPNSIISPLATWLQSASWMPSALATLSWFDWLVVGVIGFFIGLWTEVK